MTTVWKVPGMMCQHCEKTVRGALEGMPGVRSAVVNLETKTVTVEHEPSATAEAMKALLEELGYDAE